MKKFLGPILSLFVLSVGLLGVEMYCRRFVREPSDTFVAPVGNVMNRYHHAFVTWDEAVKPPDAQAFRILFLGDSFTGGSMPHGFYFPAHTVSTLEAQCEFENVSVRFQPFNLGSPSFSPSIEAVLLRDFGPRIQPHLVVLALDDSDPQDDILYSPSVEFDATGLPVSVYPALRGVPNWLDPVARRIKMLRLLFSLFPGEAPRAPASLGESAGTLLPRTAFGLGGGVRAQSLDRRSYGEPCPRERRRNADRQLSVPSGGFGLARSQLAAAVRLRHGSSLHSGVSRSRTRFRCAASSSVLRFHRRAWG